MPIIQLSQGKTALVDVEDFEMLSKFKWQHHFRGYAYRDQYIGMTGEVGKRRGVHKKVWMHREIMKTPKNMVTDHINGDRLDNRRSNLRICTQSQNQANSLLRKTNTSGYKGISHQKYGWIARLGVDGKRLYLGWFKNKEEAIKAYNQAANKYYGDFIRLNSIKESGQ